MTVTVTAAAWPGGGPGECPKSFLSSLLHTQGYIGILDDLKKILTRIIHDAACCGLSFDNRDYLLRQVRIPDAPPDDQLHHLLVIVHSRLDKHTRLSKIAADRHSESVKAYLAATPP